MIPYVVNPVIESDEYYYRHDHEIVNKALQGTKILAIGMRRSGKTSFLKRVQRAATRSGRVVLYRDLNAARSKTQVRNLVSAISIAAREGVVILLDEVESWKDGERWPKRTLSRLINILSERDIGLVLAAAPVFFPPVEQEVDDFVEPMTRHIIGPLSEREARDLVSLAKVPNLCPLDSEQIDKVLSEDDRLPLFLQAAAANAAGITSASVSVSGAVQRILSGLPNTERAMLLRVSTGLHAGASEAEFECIANLEAYGAVRRNHSDHSVSIVGRLFRASLLSSSEGIIGASAPEASSETWNDEARILHLSDLHFGEHNREPKYQAERLLEALTESLRTHDLPDFVAVTGDLSWTGHPQELRIAEVFLEGLVIWLRKKRTWTDAEARRRILLVPGNHESAWALSEGLKETEDQAAWLTFCLSPFANLANRFYRGCAIWDLERQCLRVSFPRPAVTFIAMSTCHGITRDQTAGGFSDRVIQEAKQELQNKESRSADFRIGLWHHNLRAFSGEASVAINADKAVGALARGEESGLDLALHGHVHIGALESYEARNGRKLVYVAVGSFGVRATHRPGDERRGRHPNEFALVRLQKSGHGERRVSVDFFRASLDPNNDWHWVRRDHPSTSAL